MKTLTNHKIQVSSQFRADQLRFLEKNVNEKNKNTASRSAILGCLVDLAMADPTILDKIRNNS